MSLGYYNALIAEVPKELPTINGVKTEKIDASRLN